MDPIALSPEEIVQVENEDIPHRGSKTPYIIFGLAIALIIIFVIAIVLFFVLGNAPELYTLNLVNITGSPLTVSVNDFPLITISPNEVLPVNATPGATLSIYGYNQSGGAYTQLTMWLSTRDFERTPYVTMNGSTIDASPSNNTTSSDTYNISIVNGYNVSITVTSPTSGSTVTGPTWGGPNGVTGSCPSNLLYPGVTGFYACQTPCYAQLGTIDYCCTAPNACGQTGTCTNSWIDTYTDFKNVCNGCDISNCDHIIFEGSNSNPNTYNTYTITFGAIRIIPA